MSRISEVKAEGYHVHGPSRSLQLRGVQDVHTSDLYHTKQNMNNCTKEKEN